MVNYLNKPVFLATLLTILILYSGLIKLPDFDRYISLIEKNDLSQISGKILSSPVKTNSEKYYSTKFLLSNTISSSNFESSANGKIKILIPTEIVEAYFPGKLYSDSKSSKNQIYEAGGFYTFSGNYNKNSGYFIVKNCLQSMWPKNFKGKVSYGRALCRLQFKRLMYSWGEGGGLLLALLCGAREYTDNNTKEYFKNAGLSHILALSGMHLSMFSSIAIFFGKKIGRKKLTFIIRIIALIIFVWFAGFSPSLTRAFICSMLIIVSSIASVRQPDMLLILAFSFLLQIIISPQDLLNAGFLLSYGALAGILLTNNIFRKFYDKFLPIGVSASISSSSGAQIFTTPISLKLFKSFSPVGILATVVISPLVTVYIYSGLILIILSFLFPNISSYSGILINFLYNIIKQGVRIFSMVPRIEI